MRRFVLAQLSLCLALLAQTLSGQESSVDFTRVPGEKSPVLLPPDVAELEIALGRLRMVPDRFRIVRKHEQWPLTPADPKASQKLPDAGPANLGQRSFQVSATEGRPALRLSYSDANEKWSVHIDGLIGAEWSRQFKHDGQDVQIEYSQKPYQEIEIKITEGHAQPKVLRGMTLWHLTQQESPEFTDYVLPSLNRLNASWDLPKALASAKRMRDQSRLAARLGEHQLAQYLADLDSGDHRVRNGAKQKMREAGLAAQIPLVKLRQGRLSPQQLSTVNELLSGLEPSTADTPTRIAYWLSGDPSWR